MKICSTSEELAPAFAICFLLMNFIAYHEFLSLRRAGGSATRRRAAAADSGPSQSPGTAREEARDDGIAAAGMRASGRGARGRAADRPDRGGGRGAHLLVFLTTACAMRARAYRKARGGQSCACRGGPVRPPPRGRRIPSPARGRHRPGPTISGPGRRRAARAEAAASSAHRHVLARRRTFTLPKAPFPRMRSTWK